MDSSELPRVFLYNGFCNFSFSKMMNRFRQVVNNVITAQANAQFPSGVKAVTGSDDSEASGKKLRHPYSRPVFLNLTEEEVGIATDIVVRPILVPRDLSNLPWYSGYAEVVNAGKSKQNEDQAAAGNYTIKGQPQEPATKLHSPENGPAPIAQTKEVEDLPEDINITYFGVFDGHAGSGAAVMASHTLHHIILEKLASIQYFLMNSTIEQRQFTRSNDNRPAKWPFGLKDMSVETMVIGALEKAFIDMDKLIGQQKQSYFISGGCTSLIAVFLFDKLYISNAGDSRAIICRGGEVIQMSSDFTPLTERRRLQAIANQRPELLGDEFTSLEYQKRVQRKDLGKMLLFRDSNMSGWALKRITEEDLKFPLIFGEGKRARVLATIGVTRGFGDHELKVCGTDIRIKPFLSPAPEVKVYNLFEYDHSENDVLIMGTDGLWDVLSNERAAAVVNEVLESFPANDYKRYASAAQELVMAARGVLREKGWRIHEDKPGSGDDITVFVIPLSRHQNMSRENSFTESREVSPSDGPSE